MFTQILQRIKVILSEETEKHQSESRNSCSLTSETMKTLSGAVYLTCPALCTNKELSHTIMSRVYKYSTVQFYFQKVWYTQKRNTLRQSTIGEAVKLQMALISEKHECIYSLSHLGVFGSSASGFTSVDASCLTVRCDDGKY